MLVYLFAEPNTTGTGYLIRPVCYADPLSPTIPLWLKPEEAPDAAAWIAAHGWPVWDLSVNGVSNCKRLADRLGYWPKPLDVPSLEMMKDHKFNDPIPFDLSHGTAQTIGEKFEQYHKENPEIFDLFWHYADQVWDTGRRRFGAKAIFERIRWHMEIEKGSDGFKLNNNYTARYARLLEETDPRFVGFFEKRKLRGG